MSLAGFGVRKPVVANLVMFAIIAAGLMFGVGLTREFFPHIDSSIVTVTAPYPGAAPSEVEDSLAVKIEDAVWDLDGVKEINTTARDGMATVAIEFEDGVDADVAAADVKREVDALQDLPEDSDRIVVTKLEPNLPVIILSLYGDQGERAMKDAVRSIRDDLESLPGMGDVVMSGARVDEVVVEVRPEAVIEHGLSLPEIALLVREDMAELPGGSVRSATANVSIRTLGADERAADIREVVVKASDDGQVVRLGDIAEVHDGFADVDIRQRLNGKRSVSLTIYKVGDEDAVEMAEIIKAYVAGRTGEDLVLKWGEKLKKLVRKPGDTSPVSRRVEAYELGASRAMLPLPGELALTTDLARFIVGRLNLLMRNATMGGILVFATLLLLLNWRVSFWVALGLVVSLLGTLVMMKLAGITLNLLTMFGLIIVIGILVDDAIVVAENITARHERGEESSIAAVRGTDEVAWPVFATVLTTICAFLPLTMIGGQIGDFLAVLPIVVVSALSVSLIESLFILPAHMAHSLRANDDRDKSGAGWFGRLETRFDHTRDALFDRIVVSSYMKLLRVSLKYRYLALSVAIGLVVVSAGLVVGGRVPFTFLGTADSETVSVELRMPVGTPASVTDEYMRKIEAACLAQAEVQSAFVLTGVISSLDGGGSNRGSHMGQAILELKAVEDRELPADEVIFAIRRRLGEMPGIKSLRFEETQGGPSGAPIAFAIVGDDPGQLQEIAETIKERLGDFEGVFDISDDSDGGQREMQLHLRAGASELGFTMQNVSQQVRGAVLGLEAYTFAGDREDVDVRVIYPERVRRSLAGVEELYLITPTGEAVPLLEMVRVEEAKGYATVRRLDRKRAVTVKADVDTTGGTKTQVILGTLMPELRALVGQYPGVTIVERGQQKNMSESFASLPMGMLLAIGLIYIILAWLFGSYVQPVIVLMAVPFALIGMIWGHLVLGFDMTILSLIGFIALSGIVVNDSLIFMAFFNQSRERGEDIYQACLSSGRARVRAILLTTITTVLGLLPLMLEQSFQARFLIPMAITISGGLISATLIVLVVLPALLMIFADIKRVLGALWTGDWGMETAGGVGLGTSGVAEELDV